MPTHVIYARKSTESEDRQILSIESQIAELQALAGRRGLNVGEILTESRSAKAPGRPVFGALMRRVQRGEISGVLAWKMDRLARNHLDTGLILQALADGKLPEVITTDRTYTRDGNDRFMGNFELGMATKYIDDLRQNVKRGNRARFCRGWVNHTPPLGYLMDPATKTIVKDSARYDQVRRMWEMLLTGAYRPRQIAKMANEKWGFRTRQFKRQGGRPLSSSVLYAVFGNVFYTGLIQLRSGETFIGAHPPMVAREEFDRAQALLGRPGRERPKHHEFAFTGLIRCGTCGGMVTAEEHVKPSGRQYVYYRCSHQRARVTCTEAALPESHLEAQILPTLRRLTIPKRTFAWIAKRVEQTFATDQGDFAAARATLQHSLVTANRETETLLSLRLRDLVDDATYLARKQALDAERARLQLSLNVPTPSPTERAQRLLGVFRFAEAAARTFESGDRVRRRMILQAVGLNYQLKDRILTFSVKTPLVLIAARADRPDWSACLEDVRTWVAQHFEDFSIPDLDAPYDDPSVSRSRVPLKEGEVTTG